MNYHGFRSEFNPRGSAGAAHERGHNHGRRICYWKDWRSSWKRRKILGPEWTDDQIRSSAKIKVEGFDDDDDDA